MLIHASRAALDGRHEDARAHLIAAIASFDRASMHLHAHVARVRFGRLIGGDEGAVLVAGAEAWMRGEGIARPDGFVRMLAPGFEPA